MLIRGRLEVALSPLGLGLCMLMALSTPAGATTLLKMGLPELVKHSDRVVQARAVDERVYWDDASRMIFTETTFDVSDSPKGRGDKKITIKLMGGRVGPYEATVEGTPQFAIGEEYILFTEPLPDGKRHLTGFSQGYMRISRDPKTGAAYAHSDYVAGVNLVGATGEPEAGGARRSRAPLEPLKAEIRRLAAETGPAQPGMSDKPASPMTQPVDRQTP